MGKSLQISVVVLFILLYVGAMTFIMVSCKHDESYNIRDEHGSYWANSYDIDSTGSITFTKNDGTIIKMHGNYTIIKNEKHNKIGK